MIHFAKLALPYSTHWLHNLKMLDLRYNTVSSFAPPWTRYFNKYRNLDIRNNDLVMPNFFNLVEFPDFIFDQLVDGTRVLNVHGLDNLGYENLYLSVNLEYFCKYKVLNFLLLENVNISGSTIPTCLGKEKKLSYLGIGDSIGLPGTLPDTIYNLLTFYIDFRAELKVNHKARNFSCLPNPPPGATLENLFLYGLKGHNSFALEQSLGQLKTLRHANLSEMIQST